MVTDELLQLAHRFGALPLYFLSHHTTNPNILKEHWRLQTPITTNVHTGGAVIASLVSP